MSPGQFDDLLKGLQRRQPFRMFTIELNTGERYQIDDPFAIVVEGGMGFFLAPGGVPVWFGNNSVTQVIESPASGQAG
ncbi:MAG: hypothetical protein ACRC7O_12250 [Fimbriiglobus sp.]